MQAVPPEWHLSCFAKTPAQHMHPALSALAWRRGTMLIGKFPLKHRPWSANFPPFARGSILPSRRQGHRAYAWKCISLNMGAGTIAMQSKMYIEQA